MNTNFSEYTHPLLINGERFFLNKNPFLYAEEGVLKYWPERAEELSYTLAWEEMQKGRDVSSPEHLLVIASKILAPHFLKDDDFFRYFRQDGGDMIKETKSVQKFEHDEEDFLLH